MGLPIILGGIGLFLLGMNMLTEGLKQLADEKLKMWLNRFTGGTFSSIFFGALITMMIQSSNATIIITIGFVSAGLISFVQSVGIIIGANIGTTSIGWIISLVGFKIDLTAISLPIVGIGVFFSLFAKNQLKPFGNVLAGFGLLFLGIATLQNGMLLEQEWLALDFLADGKLWQNGLLIVMGFIMTVIMQSSGASVATTLALLNTNAIVFEQAAFLVIGHNIGTTVTAFIASFGATATARRTALTHVIFNYVTAIIVVFLMPMLLPISKAIGALIDGSQNTVFGIAVFHTLFSVIGAIIFIPFIALFTKLMLKIVPERGNPLTQFLDKNVATVPAVAYNATYNTLLGMVKELTIVTLEFFRTHRLDSEAIKKLANLEEAVIITRKFLTTFLSSSLESQSKQLSLIHALDHIERLIKAILEGTNIKVDSLHENTIADFYNILILIPDEHSFDENLIDSSKLQKIATSLKTLSAEFADNRKIGRDKYFLQSVRSETKLDTAMEKVQALLWIDRLAFHYWRTMERMTECAVIEDENIK